MCSVCIISFTFLCKLHFALAHTGRASFQATHDESTVTHTHTHINKEWQYTYIILFSLILIWLFWIIYKECFGSFSSLNTQAHLRSLKNIFAYLLLAFFCKHMGASCGCIHVSTHYRFNIVPHFWPFSSVCNNIQWKANMTKQLYRFRVED